MAQTLAPAPWKLRCDAYWLMYTAKGALPNDAYAPLESDWPAFSDPAKVGAFKGGLATAQFIRYSETPVGPYDELLLTPGAFESPPGRPAKSQKPTSRVTRIYVSQEATLYNGRRNWNIPKHLARFEVTNSSTQGESAGPLQSVSLTVFPLDPNVSKPFFRATFTPMRWVPGFAFSTTALRGLPGPDLTIVQPPLPQGDTEVMVGTKQWCSLYPDIKATWGNAKLVWVEEGNDVEQEGFFPSDLGFWKVGVYLKNAAMNFGEPETWEA
ncbi:MAG: hypothetical protein M1814_005569 [Vezdaea aestivalis]|nr:MAG: hypothetical protein M1814_005569 [Vezdaea aestivalis]